MKETLLIVNLHSHGLGICAGLDQGRDGASMVGRWCGKAVPGILVWLALACQGAMAQNANCDRLQAQLASQSQGDPARASRYARAAQKQRTELDRTSTYASSIGCSNRKFLIFGSSPPPQCGAIEAQMERMRSNLAQLQAEANTAGGGSQAAARDLNARFQAQCRGPRVASAPEARARNVLEDFFGSNPKPKPFEQIPLNPPPGRDPMSDDEDETPALQHGGSKAVCVRTCDGGFFPVSYSARRSGGDQLNELCRALCPNAEVKLFTMSNGADIADAVSPDGDSYSGLPNAFKFQKSFDAACTCKPQGKNWVETLAEAERLLGTRAKSTDLILTQQKSDELARPTIIMARGKAAAGKNAPPAAADTAPTVVADETAPETTAAIEPKFREITGPDGIKRRVRLVGPQH